MGVRLNTVAQMLMIARVRALRTVISSHRPLEGVLVKAGFRREGTKCKKSRVEKLPNGLQRSGSAKDRRPITDRLSGRKVESAPIKVGNSRPQVDQQ